MVNIYYIYWNTNSICNIYWNTNSIYCIYWNIFNNNNLSKKGKSMLVIE